MTRAQRLLRATVETWTGAEPIDAPIEVAAGRTGTISSDRGASIELHDISKSYGSVRAVDKFSLAVEPGHFVTLLGPSGSGKTTVLQLIAGLIEPTSGSLRINGQLMDRVPPDRRNIGVVFQHFALFPHLTVARNLAFPLEMRHLERRAIEARVGEAMELVGLGGLENRLPRQLSGGQQQRVALARALIYRPPIILMDEPLGALDKNLRQQMQVEIKRIQSDLQLTVIYVTHDQAEALAMSDEICVMEAGRVVQVGAPRQLYDRPANQFVATFLGEANLFDGQVSEIDADAGLIRAAGPHGLSSVASVDSSRQPAALGTPVTLVVRPEDVQISTDRNGHGGFDALVETVAFVGDSLRVQLSADGRSALVARLPKATADPPRVGSIVNVSWAERQATFVINQRR